jgi:hypothetical protein
LAAITIIVFTLNKWSTIYDFKERLRGSVVGIAVFATCIFCFGFTRSYATKNQLDIYKGTSFTLISEFGQKNTFSESFQEAIDKEMIDMGWKEMETVNPTEPGATDTTTPTETAPTESGQLVPPVEFE